MFIKSYQHDIDLKFFLFKLFFYIYCESLFIITYEGKFHMNHGVLQAIKTEVKLLTFHRQQFEDRLLRKIEEKLMKYDWRTEKKGWWRGSWYDSLCTTNSVVVIFHFLNIPNVILQSNQENLNWGKVITKLRSKKVFFCKYEAKGNDKIKCWNRTK